MQPDAYNKEATPMSLNETYRRQRNVNGHSRVTAGKTDDKTNPSLQTTRYCIEYGVMPSL